MKLTFLFPVSLRNWQGESSLSRFLSIVVLSLVVLAYLPTLLFDYVPQDQWRTFRYSHLEQTAYEQLVACTKSTVSFYVATGRPFVWVGECIEHALVGEISDFAYLRPFVLLLVLATVVYLGALVARILGGLPMGFAASALFVFTPGYSFMYYQGMTAGFVLIGLLLAVVSFSRLNQWLDKPGKFELRNVKQLPWVSLFLFIFSCMTYPAWSFVVIPLAWAFFLFDVDKTKIQRVKDFIITLGFYFFSTMVYYSIIKFLVAINFLQTATYKNLGAYEMSILLNIEELLEKIILAKEHFFSFNFLNILTYYSTPVFLLGVFSIYMGWEFARNEKNKVFASVFWIACLFLIGVIVLYGSISPWLFSHQEGPNIRNLIPWSLFLCLGVLGLIWAMNRRTSQKFRNLVSIFVVGLFLTPSAILQNKFSFWETAVSGIEIQTLRSELGKWIDNKGYDNKKYILIVMPPRESVFIENQIRGYENLETNIRFTSRANPVSILWMVNAILRERKDHPIGKTVGLRDCRFDQLCVQRNLVEGVVSLLHLNMGHKVVIKNNHLFVINLSSLTSEPFLPELIPPIRALSDFSDLITTSSQYQHYGPQGLFDAKSPPWHAARPPEYPVSITVKYYDPKEVRTLNLLPQDSQIGRAPKMIQVENSDDGKTWTQVTSVDNPSCAWNTPPEWTTIKFPEPVRAKFFKLVILSNCGDPDLLTLSGMRYE